MNITINDVLKMKPCKRGIRDFYKVVGTSYDKDTPLDMELLVNKLNLYNLCWVLGKLHKKEILLKLAIRRAEQVLHIYEESYDSDAPRLAIEAAKVWAKEPTKQNSLKVKAIYVDAVAAAHSAAANFSARSAANAICAAANAAAYSDYTPNAIWATTNAAAYSAYTTNAAYSAYAAAAAYVTDTAKSSNTLSSKLLDKQIRAYLLSLLKEDLL